MPSDRMCCSLTIVVSQPVSMMNDNRIRGGGSRPAATVARRRGSLKPT